MQSALMPQSQTAEDTRTSIMNAALRLFGERGYHATSLQEVIKAAGCSKGAFYHYFESKEDLLLLFHDTFIDHLLAFAERAARAPGDPLDNLLSILRHLLESMSTFHDHMAVFNNESRFLTQEKFKLVQTKRDRYEAVVRSLVEEAIRRGELRADLDPKIFSFAVLGTFNWAFRWFRPGQPLNPEEMSAVLFRILLEGGIQRT
ncbi:MAG: TetR/AcrR family transcriptional regulator [Thermaerobacter sp.]|nr:TetR/AcrR family transcriptional regulator [Thermaerobacter sp.]